MMRTTRLTSWLLGSLCALTTASCQGDDPTPYANSWCQIAQLPALADVKVTYAQTYCADPWGPSQGAQHLQTVATAYLLQRGIASARLQAIDKNPAAVCRACTCTTGVVLEGVVSNTDLAAALTLGFKPQPTQR